LAEQLPNLEFSEKYSREHAQGYHHKHKEGLARRASNWWEQRMARRALRIAGDPRSILDLPCGAGRFWVMLAKDPDRELLAADNSEHMLAVADHSHAPEVRNRFKLFQTSVFDIDLPNNAVESIFCMRLLHHIGEAENRLQIYREFHRVTRDSVCLSLWVDGNYKARRRKRLEARRPAKAYQNRFVLERGMVEAEFALAGFAVLGHVDFLPGYAMWRTYVLKKQH
jgi:ubiquinone/menaquinone biosynthesis C-methylase UbiE